MNKLPSTSVPNEDERPASSRVNADSDRAKLPNQTGSGNIKMDLDSLQAQWRHAMISIGRLEVDRI